MSQYSQVKVSSISHFKDVLSHYDCVVFARYSAITFHDLQSIRAYIRQSGGLARCFKSRLAFIAILDALDKDVDIRPFKGSSFFIFFPDPFFLSRYVASLQKDYKNLCFTGIFSHGSLHGKDFLKTIAFYNSCDEVRQFLLFGLQNPLRTVLFFLQANFQVLLFLLKSKSDQG